MLTWRSIIFTHVTRFTPTNELSNTPAYTWTDRRCLVTHTKTSQASEEQQQQCTRSNHLNGFTSRFVLIALRRCGVYHMYRAGPPNFLHRALSVPSNRAMIWRRKKGDREKKVKCSQTYRTSAQMTDYPLEGIGLGLHRLSRRLAENGPLPVAISILLPSSISSHCIDRGRCLLHTLTHRFHFITCPHAP